LSHDLTESGLTATTVAEFVFVLSGTVGFVLSGVAEFETTGTAVFILVKVSLESGWLSFLPQSLQELSVKLRPNKITAVRIVNMFYVFHTPSPHPPPITFVFDMTLYFSCSFYFVHNILLASF
jgi:hypothetical protein